MTAAPDTNADLCEQARTLGRDAARTAATWTVDGNTPEANYRRVLAMMERGDPQVDEFLPPAPTLSGEWSGDPTPLSIAGELTGDDDPPPALVGGISDQWGQGVAETFTTACETELRNALRE